MPLPKINLNAAGIPDYIEYIKEVSGYDMDSLILSQLIQQAKNIDTGYWKENEIPFALLVGSRDEYVNRKYFIHKLGLTDKKQILAYNKKVNSFNATPPFDRDIIYFSRPAFDNAKQFAIVQWDNGHSGLGGGGGIVLYKRQGDHWEQLGTIRSWDH